MQVDNTSPSTQDKKIQRPGLAKSALGWINRVISDSVQEINDFSALLSVQTSEAAKLPTTSSTQDIKVKPATGAASETVAELKSYDTLSKDEVNLANLEKSKSAKKPKGQQVNTVSSDVVAQDSEDPELTEVKLEDGTQNDNPVAAEVIPVASQAEETAVEQQSPNILAAELLSAQLQTNKEVKIPEAEDQAVPESESPENQGKIEVKSAGADVVNLEKVPTETEKSLVDFVRSSMQKPAVTEAATQSVSDKNLDKSDDTSIQNSISSDLNESKLDIAASNTALQPGVIAPPTKSSQTAGTTDILGLSQTFLSSWTSSFSSSSSGDNSESGRAGIESLAPSKAASHLSKAASELSNASSNLAANKSNDGGFAISEKALSLSVASNNLEQGQKGESSKSTKSLTRLQSLNTLERVEAALQKASESKDGTQISLRLDPPNLGSVRVDVSFKDGSLHARISADTAQVLQLLRDKAPELQVTLRKLGLDVDRVSVSVNSGDSGTFQESSDGKRGSSEQKGGNSFLEQADSAVLKESINLDHWIA